jgi:phage terminase large subunit GpA-like protein
MGSMINGIRLFIVGTDTLKDTLFDRLKLTEFGPGYCHFPDHAAYTEDDGEYFKGLTAEKRVPKWDRGVLLGYYYRKIRSRNEPLDVRIYASAALAILNPNLETLSVMPHEPAPAHAAQARHPSTWIHPQRDAAPRSGWIKRGR